MKSGFGITSSSPSSSSSSSFSSSFSSSYDIIIHEHDNKQHNHDSLFPPLLPLLLLLLDTELPPQNNSLLFPKSYLKHYVKSIATSQMNTKLFSCFIELKTFRQSSTRKVIRKAVSREFEFSSVCSGSPGAVYCSTFVHLTQCVNLIHKES